ncbi:fatty acid-binding protein, heart-like [Leguminivora glycinivorella]|uniref:fatty acid-binding protein, heart-like n=1 Tax=Leguminivora glycinivorella TaxID=1035111 RepID=UPI00200F90BA|nr:fatty acid-binding protein, heart-like [Leguminivora glycinivorella]
MDEFLGKKYSLKSSEKFEEYLEFIGKNYFQRKAALSLSQENWLTKDEAGAYTFHFHSTFASASTTFISGEEVEETRPDGVKVKALITIEGNKMTHIQTEENGRISKHERVFTPDSMTVITTFTTIYGAEKTAIRHYALVE